MLISGFIENKDAKSKLAMVDLDGTLIDTLDVNYNAYKAAFTDYGYDLTREQYREKCNGRSYKDFLPDLLGADKPYMEAIHERKKEVYVDCLKYARANEHLIHILRAIKPEYYIALVTTASRRNTEEILNYFELEYLFDRVVTQEDVVRCKPAPDCYIQTREWFGVTVENTIIFEDSESGIAAAMGSEGLVFRYMGR